MCLVLGMLLKIVNALFLKYLTCLLLIYNLLFMKRFFILFLLFFITYNSLWGQALQGSILDNERNPIPFSTVFIKELNMGAVANEKGRFSIQLKEGQYQCTFQCIGYEKVTRTIEINKTTKPLEIVLNPVVYALQGVTVTPGSEDPAYPIMRHVMAKSPYFANMIKSYNADVYIRGSMQVLKLSGAVKILARKELKESGIKEGKTYMEESFNEIDFKAPNIFKHKVKSIQSSMPKNNGQSGESITYLTYNFYKDSRGGLKSPIVSGAFNYYKYIFRGSVTQGGKNVFKIQIVPKGNSSDYCSGYIYVVDDLWCLSAVDLTVNGNLNTSILIHQNYSELKPNAWVPISNRMSLHVKTMGNEMKAAYNASVTYKSLVINTQIMPATMATEKNSSQKPYQYSKSALIKVNKLDKKIKDLSAIDKLTTKQSSQLAKAQMQRNDLLMRDSLRNNHEYIETYKWEKDSLAQKQDSAFWSKVRTVPLDSAEMISLKESKSKDAVDSTSKGFKKPTEKPLKAIFWGGALYSDSLIRFKTDGLINLKGLNFNAVEGVTYETKLEYEQQISKGKGWRWELNPGYAFLRKSLFGEADIRFSDWTRGGYTIGLQGGSRALDYNPQAATRFENTLYSLFLKENKSKLYLRDFLKIDGSVSLSPEFSLRGSLLAENNTMLENHSDFSFFYKNKNYNPNIPDSADFVMENHKNLTFEFTLYYKAMPYYYIKGGKRIPRYEYYNETPSLSITWRKGLPIAPFNTNYDLLFARISQQIDLRKRSSFEYSLETGCFVNAKHIYFNEYKHFAVQPLEIGLKDFGKPFQNTEYYTHSTNQWYAELHTQYTSDLLLLKRLPIIRNRLWKESLMFNYLFTPNHNHYAELGYAIGNGLWKAGVFGSMHNINFHEVKIKLMFPLFESRTATIRL